jgi:hypothetical protein
MGVYVVGWLVHGSRQSNECGGLIIVLCEGMGLIGNEIRGTGKRVRKKLVLRQAAD